MILWIILACILGLSIFLYLKFKKKTKMPANSMISIRPEYTHKLDVATRYGAVWQESILNVASSVGLPYVDLYKENATATNFFSSLESQDPLLVNIFGHGNYNLIVCQDEELLLRGGINTNVLAGRVVYDLSCQAGRDLANHAISEGCISFLGYNEDFIFAISEGSHPDCGMDNPLADEVAKGFFESHNTAPISYIQGKELADTYYDSQARFNYWINVWNSIDSQVAGFLLWDRDHQVMKPTVTIPIGLKLFPLIFAFVPLLIIPLSKHLKKLKLL